MVALVVTINVFDVLPGATVTLGGTVATEAFELTSVTTLPPLGAAADNVTVPVTELPPTILVGLRLSDASAGRGGGGGGGAGLTVNVAVLVTPSYSADSVTMVVVLTADVVMPKVADGFPCATVTLPGTETTLLVLESETFAPLVGAAEVSVTVPVDDAPPTT